MRPNLERLTQEIAAVAGAAIEFIDELECPSPDYSMRNIRRQELATKVNALPTEVRQDLLLISRGG